MNIQMLLSLLQQVLAWISSRLISKETIEDVKKIKEANPDNAVQDVQPLKIIDQPAHPDNYGERPADMPINLIVLHYTASGSLDATVRWFQNSYAEVSAHYVIGRDGTVVRTVHEEKKAYHAGKSEWNGKKDVNRFSIGIELVNWGKLMKRGDDFFTWPNNYTNLYRESEPVFLENTWWEPYPKAQLDSLQSLINEIKFRHPINDIVGHRDVSPGRKFDPGPAFYLHNYMDILNNI